MSLRDKVKAIFAKPKESPRDTWFKAVTSLREQKAASYEKQAQLRELQQKQAEARPADLEIEKKKAALKRPAPALVPKGVIPQKSQDQIDKEALAVVLSKYLKEQQETSLKSPARFLEDAKARAAGRDDAPQPAVEDVSVAQDYPWPVQPQAAAPSAEAGQSQTAGDEQTYFLDSAEPSAITPRISFSKGRGMSRSINDDWSYRSSPSPWSGTGRTGGS